MRSSVYMGDCRCVCSVWVGGGERRAVEVCFELSPRSSLGPTHVCSLLLLLTSLSLPSLPADPVVANWMLGLRVFPTQCPSSTLQPCSELLHHLHTLNCSSRNFPFCNSQLENRNESVYLKKKLWNILQ